MATSKIRTRFAPSPSGHLHVGGARTALFCWAYAAARDGDFILRIEDTDQKRSSDAASVGFLGSLAWLGVHWNEGPELGDSGGGSFGPYFCSERLELYREHIDRLIAEGKAYRAFETSEELDAARAQARAEKRNYRYDRGALALDEATIQRYLSEGRPYVVRLRVPDDVEAVEFHDEVVGDVRISGDEFDDFVILKNDGFPTYHFAVVVDDAVMEITHVIRGQEHLNNTARHILIQEALGYPRPVYAHVSVIFNPDGSKMSKRDKDKALRAAVRTMKLDGAPMKTDGSGPVMDAETWSWWQEDKTHQLPLEVLESLAETLEVPVPEINVDDFHRAGYLPEVLVNYLALLGWSPGGDVETFDRAFFVEKFDLDRLVKSPAKFDRDKLLAFNLDALQSMSLDEFTTRLQAHCADFHPEFLDKLTDDQFRLVAEANQARSKTLEDPVRSCRFFVLPDDAIVIEESKGVRKALVKGEPNGYAHLEAFLPMLQDLASWDEDSIAGAIDSYAADHADGNMGKIAQPLRIAVTGGTSSPSIAPTLVILGRDAVVNRIQRCLAHPIAAAQA